MGSSSSHGPQRMHSTSVTPLPDLLSTCVPQDWKDFQVANTSRAHTVTLEKQNSSTSGTCTQWPAQEQLAVTASSAAPDIQKLETLEPPRNVYLMVVVVTLLHDVPRGSEHFGINLQVVVCFDLEAHSFNILAAVSEKIFICRVSFSLTSPQMFMYTADVTICVMS